MKHIDSRQHAVMLEHSFENCRDFTVGDQLLRCADRLIEAAFIANFNAPRKHLAGEQPDFAPLLHDRLIGSTRRRCEFRLMHLPVEAFEALPTSHEFAF
jgi:hypothetical protein